MNRPAPRRQSPVDSEASEVPVAPHPVAVDAGAPPWRQGATGLSAAVSDRLRSLARPLRTRDYRMLWLAQVSSELGDWATRLALTLVVYDRTRSAALSAAVVTVSLVPWVGLGQVMASWVDHLPRKTVMICADLLRAAVFGVLVAPVPIAVMFVGAFLSGLATAPFEAARYSIRVEVTDDDEIYSGAITLFGITSQLATISGFALGGALVAAVGARATFAVNAGSFVASALFVTQVRTRSAGRRQGRDRRVSVFAASRVLLGDPVLRWCSALSLSSSFAGMGIEAIAAVYGHGRPRDVAVLAMAVPVGLVVAGIAAPHSGPPRRLLLTAGLLPVVGGLAGLAVFSIGPGIVVGAIGFAISGFAISVPIPAGPVVGRRLPSSVRGPAFSLLQGAALGGQAAGAAFGGMLAGIFGPRTTCIAACAGLFLLGVAATVRLPNAKRAFVMPPELQTL
ncbi:MAG TPA: MFS transporter [Acidimicrobiales bacterium]|nr:MFS transporter [Acidimicrobiales bacterium]